MYSNHGRGESCEMLLDTQCSTYTDSPKNLRCREAIVPSVGLRPVLLEVLLELFSLLVPNIDRANAVICLFQLNRTIANVLAYIKVERKKGKNILINVPSISFQAFKKSSGSENATNPNFA